MVEVEVNKTIAASVDRVWALFSNFGDMSWLEGEQTVEAIGEGEGMIRRLHMPGMEPFDEILISMDHEARSFSYRIPKNAVVPFDNYVAVMTVTGDEQQSDVLWASKFEVSDMDPEAAQGYLADNYKMMLDSASDKLTA